MPTGDSGYGVAVSFASGFCAMTRTVGHSGLTRKKIDVSSNASVDAKDSIPSDLYDPGELKIEMLFDPSATPPIDQAPEAVTVTWPDGSTLSGTGYMTAYEPSAPFEGEMTASATITFTGALTWA